MTTTNICNSQMSYRRENNDSVIFGDRFVYLIC